jgi:hypothetical protein
MRDTGLLDGDIVEPMMAGPRHADAEVSDSEKPRARRPLAEGPSRARRGEPSLSSDLRSLLAAPAEVAVNFPMSPIAIAIDLNPLRWPLCATAGPSGRRSASADNVVLTPVYDAQQVLRVFANLGNSCSRRAGR